jgi:general secretion pathway protein D
MSDASTRILQRPQLRAIDGGKASLKIGQKIPYVSGSLNSAVATPGSIPYATTQFQQVEVGTLIDFQPHVSGGEDVYMHVRVELSNVLQQIAIAGINEPVIGQQIDEAEIRMKDGEVSILGGLSDRENTNTLSGLPGFTNIPLLGYLFGTRVKEDIDNEILLVVIPHIIRGPAYGDLASTGVYAGTERVPRVDRGGAQQQPVQVTLPTPAGPAAGVPRAANPNEVRPSFPVTAPPNVPAATATPGSATAPFPETQTPAPVNPATTTPAPATANPPPNNQPAPQGAPPRREK